jgi:peptidoglycan hydrolase CwlO-like protein
MALLLAFQALSAVQTCFAKPGVTVNLSQTSGPIGITVTVSGTLENPGAQFKIFWQYIKDWDGRYGFLVSGYAEGYSYTANITIPPAARGNHYVIVEDEKNHATGYAVFTVTPEITVQPDTAPGGAIVSVGGRLINGETIDIRFYDPISGRETTVAQAVTDHTTGALSCNFKVPAWSEGDYKVRAYWSGSLQAEAMFHIGYQGITVVPDKAPPNAIVRVSGGLAINETFIIAFENSTWSVTVATVQTDQSGWFAVNVTVPEASPGNYFVRASSDDIDVEVPFEILPPANLEVYSDAANTGEALPGFSVITAIGTNFIANANVSIYFQSNPVLVAETVAGPDGSFTAQFTVPSNAKAGTHTIFAVQDPYNVSASATIIVHSVVIAPYAMLNYPNSVVLYVPGDTIAFYVNSTTPFEVPSEIVVNVYDPSGIPYTPQGIRVNAGGDIVNVKGFYVAPYDRIAFWPEIPKGAPAGIWTWNATYRLQLYPGVQFNASGFFGVIPQADLDYILQRLNQIEAKIDGVAYKQDQLYLLIQANHNYVMARLDQLEASLVNVTQSGFAEVNTKLGAIQLKLDLLDAKVTSIQDNVAIIQTSLGTLTADVSELKNMLAKVNATIVEVKGGVATIQAGIGEIKADLAALNAIVVDVKGGVASVQTTIGALSAKLDALNATIVGVKDGLKDGFAQVETILGTVNMKLDELKAFIESSNANVTKLIVDCKGEVIAEIAAGKAELKANLNALNASVASVQAGVATLNTAVGELKVSLADLRANVTRLIVDAKGEAVAEMQTLLGPVNATLQDMGGKITAIHGNVADVVIPGIGQLKVAVASAQQSAENASEAVSGLNMLIYAVLALSIVAAALSAFNLLHMRRKETAS